MDLNFRNAVVVRLETRSQNWVTRILINREGKGMLLFMCIYMFVSVEVSFLKKKMSLERYIHEPSYNYAINIYITSKNFLPPHSLYVLLLCDKKTT